MDRATLKELTDEYSPPPPLCEARANGAANQKSEHKRSQLAPIRFGALEPVLTGRYLIKGLIPAEGLTAIWGPPKSGKSFWATDALLHVALGWPYRGQKVTQGAVVYVAAEGGSGFGARLEAFKTRHNLAPDINPPFYVIPARLGLVSWQFTLVAAITGAVEEPIAAVCLDTLNRTIEGDENSSKDMGLYIAACDEIRAALKCAVILVHHCGVAGDRPRGHTSLTGAVDAQIAVKRDHAKLVRTEVEWMKDGPEDFPTASRLEVVEVGTDEDGEQVTSCVIVAADDGAIQVAETGPKLSKNQETMFSILHRAGPRGLAVEEWNAQAREAGIGVKRKADLYDIRERLRDKGLAHESQGRWYVTD